MPEPSSDRLALLYRVSQTFNSSLDLDEVLNRVMDEVIAATHAERGFVMLRDAAGQLAFRAARGLDQQTVAAPEYQISRGLVEKVAQTGEPVLTMDAQNDAWLQTRQSVVGLRLRSILCVPLQLKDRIIGVVYVDNPLHAGIFAPDDLELLTSIAASAAVAIENARLYQVAVEKGRQDQELRLARQVQASLLPRSVPVLAGWEFAARWDPAREVAGDFYDFIPAGGGVSLLVADVTDKGMPAALFMAHTRSVLRANLSQLAAPAESLNQANRLLCEDETGGMFVTMFSGHVMPGSGRLVYVNAGHNPALLCRAGGGETLRLTRTGMPLAVEASLPYQQREVEMEAGDCLLLYTDGVTDALNGAGEEFGEARLLAALLAARGQPAENAVAAVASAVEAFAGGRDLFDDLTLMVVRRT